MKRGRRRAQQLRQAIDCLPARTREAMLTGLDENEIIVGAYTDNQGGVCPMLAAHRRGGRTSLASFARAWDRYTDAKRPRLASERELRTLRAMLEASLYHDGADLKTAADEHRELVERAPRRDTEEHNRFEELRHRAGWAWLRVFRRYDEYEAALAQIEDAQERAEQERDRELV
jgi:hypothetical protein